LRLGPRLFPQNGNNGTLKLDFECVYDKAAGDLKELMESHERVVLITGAKGGLGTFVTQAFLQDGARVIGVSRSISDSDFPHERFSAMPAEISGGESAAIMIDAVAERWGSIDALVHLVGGFAGGRRVEEAGDDVVDRMLGLNFRSAFHLIRAVLPYMRKQRGGRILAIGSKAAAEPAPMAAAYAASKAALVSLIRTVARENSDRRITTNVVLPGTMDTPANRASDPTADFSKWVNPCQVASLLVHLASDRASHINGAVIPIYGGEA
jgi:NAD(P)-dependent dehydrogenase (short-subunit alcohol dehydrogenase family)